MKRAMKRPISTLAEYLGDGSRFEGFECWVQALTSRERTAESPTEASALRMLSILTVACQEAFRRETEQHNQPIADTLLLLARMAGMAVMAPTLDFIEDSEPADAKDLVEILVDEFGYGAEFVLEKDADARMREEARFSRDGLS